MASTRPGRPASSMLQGAVDEHEKHRTAARSNPRNLFTSSSVSKPIAQQTIPGGYPIENALKPAAASTHNIQRPYNASYALNQGTKRMANGLAKALNSSFEDERSKQKEAGFKPASQLKKPVDVVVLDEIDENDFESDVDLDVEEPRAASLYPTLPKQKSVTPSRVSAPVVYPTLPRQQQMQTTYHDMSDLAIPSSMPLDWSSSPAHHLQPSLPPSAISRKRHDNAKPSSQKDSGKAVPSSARTLPWLRTEAVDLTSEDAEKDHFQFENAEILDFKAEQDNHQPQQSIIRDKSAQTPVVSGDKKKKTADLWNGSASTIKEQLKKHREEARPAIKKNEATSAARAVASSKHKKVPKVFLSEEQQHVLNLVVKDKASTFFTGSAGTGKSVLLREIIAAYRRQYVKEPDRVAVTASTGLAACNIGGTTLHSFAGIGLGKDEPAELVKKVKRNQKAKQRWLRTKVLIIDEVSMLDADLFDKLENVARIIRNNGRPFGGIQLVITGDFFQLPPVPDSGRVAKFCFDAAQWNTVIKHTIGLHHVFRQKDPVFAGMLNEMREGRLSNSSIMAFKKLSRNLTFEDTIDATELFPTRREVERANATRLAMLQGNSYVFEAKDGGEVKDKVARDKILANCMAPETITLKKGAQVMLIKNIDDDLVNGSIGRVIAFMDEKEFEKFRVNDDVFAQVEAGEFAEFGEFAVSKEESARRRLQDNITTSRKYPMVRFQIADGTTRDMLCQQESWKVELPSGEVQASRNQIPLILSWALSIHKAQGQTLERVKVDLGTVFEKGQAYVALSRATSMAGLQVLRFDASKVLAHDRVRTFYSNLAKIELQADKQAAAHA